MCQIPSAPRAPIGLYAVWGARSKFLVSNAGPLTTKGSLSPRPSFLSPCCVMHTHTYTSGHAASCRLAGSDLHLLRNPADGTWTRDRRRLAAPCCRAIEERKNILKNVPQEQAQGTAGERKKSIPKRALIVHDRRRVTPRAAICARRPFAL